MYAWGVKAKKKSEPMILRDKAEVYEADAEAMVRTQIYLTRAEHGFLQGESARTGKPMAAVIRELIDDKMMIPDEAWTNNPLLEPTVEDPDYQGHEDSSLNHDHYVYGGPKKYEKSGAKWVLQPPIDE